MEDEDEDEWDLDYDGATRWLPPMSELRRSLSPSQTPEEQTYYTHQPVDMYGHEGFHRSSSFGYGLVTPGYQATRLQGSSPMYYYQKSQTYDTTAQRAYPTPPENPPYKAHRRGTSKELKPGVSDVRPSIEEYESARRESRQTEHHGLTPHEQQMREFDRDLDLPSAFGYYTHRSVRASH